MLGRVCGRAKVVTGEALQPDRSPTRAPIAAGAPCTRSIESEAWSRSSTPGAASIRFAAAAGAPAGSIRRSTMRWGSDIGSHSPALERDPGALVVAAEALRRAEPEELGLPERHPCGGRAAADRGIRREEPRREAGHGRRRHRGSTHDSELSSGNVETMPAPG